MFIRARKKICNVSVKKRNGIRRGPQKIEEVARTVHTSFLFDYGTDRASEKNEADQYRKDGQCIHVRKTREKWVCYPFLSLDQMGLSVSFFFLLFLLIFMLIRKEPRQENLE